jgi:hypothetical protein
VSATDIFFQPRAVDASHGGGGEERPEVVDNVVNVVAGAAVDGPVGRIAHPSRGHAQSGGRDQISRNVFDHKRGAGAHLVTPQQFVVAGERRLRIIPGRGDVDDAAERAGNAQMVEQPLGMALRAVGMDDLAAGQSRQRLDENRVGRYAGEVDLVHISQEILGVDPVDRHQTAHRRPVLAEIGLLYQQRPFRRQAQPVGDEARHARVDLVEEPAGGGVERVVEIKNPSLDFDQRPATHRIHSGSPSRPGSAFRRLR